MLHRLFAIDHTATGGDHGLFHFDLAVDAVFHLNKSICSNFRNDLPEQLSFLLLDDKIRIYKFIAQYLCKHNSCRAFSHSGHSDQYYILHISYPHNLLKNDILYLF